MNRRRQKILGFTLVELLIVILIIAVILGFALTVFNTTKKNARDQQRLRDLTSIKQALELYRSDNHSYPASLSLISQYLVQLPTDPLGGSRTYQYSQSTTSFILCAKKEGSATLSNPSGCGSLLCISPSTYCDMGIASD